MSQEPQVKPLRISKNTPQSTPKKMSGGRNSGQSSWPLSEISPMGIRRNSPSHYSPSNMPGGFKADSSPFDPSPAQATMTSPRHFWKEKERYSPGRGAENTPSPHAVESPTRRSSIEKLMKASRVKNSSMFAREATQEYDPAREPVIERPLAHNRPLSVQVQGNAWSGKGIEGLRTETSAHKRHSRTDSVTQLPEISTPKKQAEQKSENISPSRMSPSPTKSSLSSASKYQRRSYDPNAYSDDESPAGKTLPPGRSLHRHAKSVTFDAAPPEIRQFEMPTPDLSSVGTCSPAASYNSEDDDSYEQDADQDENTQRHDGTLSKQAYKAALYDPFVDVSAASPNAVNSASFSSQDTAETSSPGDRRPLPPIPGMGSPMAVAQSSRDSSPDKASPAGSIVRNEMPSGKPTLSERLSMIMNKESPRFDTVSMQAQRERRLRRAGSKEPEKNESPVNSPARALPAAPSPSVPYHSPAARYQAEEKAAEETTEEFHSFVDPDMPLPSTETDAADDESVKSDDDSAVDLYSIPQASMSQVQIAMSHSEMSPAQEDTASQTSETDAAKEMLHSLSKLQLMDTETAPLADFTVPQFSSSMLDDSFKPSFAVPEEREATPVMQHSFAPTNDTIRESSVETATQIEKEVEEEDRPSSPESVIRHPVTEAESPVEEQVTVAEPTPEPISEPAVETPAIPEPVATIKTSGGKLKVRASATPADLAAMAAARRQVSGERPPEDAPEPPLRSPRRLSAAMEVDTPEQNTDKAQAARARRKSLLQLDLPVMATNDDFLFGLDKDFDRVIEDQKRGYLMRQNTKVIVASSTEEPDSTQDGDHSRVSRSAGNSPVKKSRMSQSWEVEPWNGKTRRNSIKSVNNAQVKRKMVSTAPPLPGQESAVSAMESVTEDAVDEPDLDEDEAERGRLFVKVMAVKDLDLQLPSGERAWFNLTLDNGLHCVTTAWLELGRNAPIGQEFELIVLNDLEFQLSLAAKMEKPVHHVAFKAPEKVQKTSALSRVFASPKKRKERERQEEEDRLARQRQQEMAQRRPTVYDALQGIAGEDGSFARSYICSKEHEKNCYGRALTVEVPCFNEWAADKSYENAAGKKRSLSQAQAPRRPPYKIGKLELQLLFVPKPKGVVEPDMPKSMNMCLRQLSEARAASAREWQGHLSQQGGDCPYWRRRLFKISGSKMVAYHEATRQIRATINLVKATRLIDDKSALTKREVGSGKSRRKSGFTDEEEGYTFVENGFRIKFSNGETIDFYANTAEEKEGCMKVLTEIVGKDTKPGWIQLVLAREAADLKAAKQQQLAAKSTRPLPASQQQHQRAPPSPTRAAPAGRLGASPTRPMAARTGAVSPTRPAARAPVTASPTRPAPRAGAASPTRQAVTPSRPPVTNRASYMGHNTPSAATGTPRSRFQASPEKRRPVSTIL